MSATEPSPSSVVLRPLGRGLQDVADDELMQRIADHGNDAALAEIVERFSPRVRGYLRHILGSDGWVDDVAQEVFVRVYEQASRYDKTFPLIVWLMRIARNLAIDLQRRLKVRSNAVEIARELHADDTAPSPLDRLTRSEFHEQLCLALSQLPEAFRTVFVLKEMEQLSYEEIAAVVGVPAKTVSTRLHRARQRLRGLLAPYLEGAAR